MKILVLSQYYAPENVPIPEQIARGLSERGHHVQVLTTFPSYPSGAVSDGYRQSLRLIEMKDGIRITRVPSFTDHSTNLVRRALTYTSFAASSATAASLVRGADVVYVYATQLTAAWAPWLHRLLGGSPYVLHVQDLWPDSILGSTFAGTNTTRAIIKSAVTAWARTVYGRASGTIGIAPSMVRLLIERGSDKDRTRLIYNWTSEGGARNPRNTRSENDPLRVLYAGNIGEMQDLENVVVAGHMAAQDNVHLKLVGEGTATDRVDSIMKKLGASNVTLEGRVSPEEMPELYRNADFTLIPLKNLPVFEATIPSKFQASLYHGTPVIAAVPGDLSRIVEQYSLGFVSEPSNPSSLCTALRQASRLSPAAYKNLVENARNTYVDVFSEEAAMDAIEDALFEAVNDEQGSAIENPGSV